MHGLTAKTMQTRHAYTVNKIIYKNNYKYTWPNLDTCETPVTISYQSGSADNIYWVGDWVAFSYYSNNTIFLKSFNFVSTYGLMVLVFYTDLSSFYFYKTRSFLVIYRWSLVSCHLDSCVKHGALDIFLLCTKNLDFCWIITLSIVCMCKVYF